MFRSNPIREVLVTGNARYRLTGEEICQALAAHQPEKFFSLLRDEKRRYSGGDERRQPHADRNQPSLLAPDRFDEQSAVVLPRNACSMPIIQ